MNDSSRFLALFLVSLGLGLGLAVYLFSREISVSPPAADVERELAVVSQIQGQARVLAYGETQKRTLEEEAPKSERTLQHLDLLQTGLNSQALLTLPSGYELRLEPHTQILLEAWGQEPQSPTYIHLLSGNFEVLRAGQRGQVFVLRDRKLFYPEGSTAVAQYELVIQAPLQASDALDDTASTGDDVEPLEEEEIPIPQGEVSSELPATLSNEEIDEALARYRAHFERCQTNALRENQQAQGRILVGITISPEGKMQEVRVISSELKSPSFQNCILSVFERARFRPFQGPVITRSYPLVFD